MADGVGTTHAVKIGDHHYTVRPGSYRKRPAPTFGSRFTTGDPDYNTLSAWQYWAQTCWVGGFGAETWRDDAMFDEGVGIDASQHEVMTLSRDLGPATRATWVLDGNTGSPHIFQVWNGNLYCLSTNIAASKLYKYTDGSPGSWSLIYTFPVDARWLEPFGNYLVFGTTGANIYRMDTSEVMSTFAKPGGVTAAVYTLKKFRDRLYVGFGDQIWRLKTDYTWDGSTAFWDSADTINYINQSEIHLGFLYFASRNGHIIRTDGNNTFDLWAFEPHVAIWGIRSFDGKLFIGVAEEIEGTDSAQTVLYQFSGAAVTELKRWGKVGYDGTPGKLRAYERKLFFGASNLLGMGSKDGFGIACYDPVEDAFHMFASNQDGVTYPPGTEGVNNRVDDVVFYKGRLFTATRGYGVFVTPWTFHDVTREQATYDTTAAGAAPGSQNGGWYESSDFDAGTPGLLKLWNSITLHVDIPGTAGVGSLVVEHSVDGGHTWAYAGGTLATATVERTGTPTRLSRTIMLGVAGAPLRATRLKYRITFRTTSSTVSPQLRGAIVRYLPIPEPTWMWDMTLVLSESQELLDGTIQSPDNATKIAALRAAFRTQNLVAFTEPGGTQWASGGAEGVLMYQMEELVPHIGPTSEGALEYEVRLTLMEMVEAYE